MLQPKPSREELADPDALAFYSAQQALLAKTVGVAHRPGSVKKSRAPPSFGATARAAVNERVPPDVAMAMHPGRKQQ